MNEESVYNPLDKDHLAESIGREFFRRKFHPLPPETKFNGAGIYALYYVGDYPLYKEVSDSFREFHDDEKNQRSVRPIYIGKSDPPGSRKGLKFEQDDDEETAKAVLSKKARHSKLFSRLCKHEKSIAAANNLKVSDFQCRYMLVDEVWVALGEARLVEWFKPLWNVMIEGFGSNPEGGGRKDTARSVWDIIHPGRKELLSLQVAPERVDEVVNALRGATTSIELRTAIKAHREARLQYRKDTKVEEPEE